MPRIKLERLASLLVSVLAASLLLAALPAWCYPPTISAASTILYVAPGGSCGGMSPCYAQVQPAVDAAATGDEVRVAAGVYYGVSARSGTTQTVYLDKSITLRGGYNPATWAYDPGANPTILDAGGNGHVLYITGEAAPLIEGLRLTRGAGQNGGGIYVQTAAAALRHNQIYSNTAELWGAGIFLLDSAATLNENQIYSNTTGSSGHGGGLFLSNSPAKVYTNTIHANRAHIGGGVELDNTAAQSGALLQGNTIQDNTAFAYSHAGNTFDGAGGGIHIGSGYTDTLKNNIIRRNTAGWGGGVHTFNAPAILSSNTIQQNYASIHGGGLYIQGSHPTLQHNLLISNTADSWGGGVCMWVSTATIEGNTFQGNAAGWRGGGLYTRGAAVFDSNLFLYNSAAEQGGGIFAIEDNGAAYRNSVIASNHAREGGGVYLWGSTSSFVHTTLAGNTSPDGNSVVIDRYPGLVDPGAPTQIASSASFTNTILSGELITGFFTTADNTLLINGILWHNVGTRVKASGAHLTLLNEYTGDPHFEPNGYHLEESSAASDRSPVEVLDHDADGQLRPVNLISDLGADEAMLSAAIDPLTGGSVAYHDPQQGLAISVTVPPGAVDAAMELMLIPWPPPLPPGGIDPKADLLSLVGPPFSLTPLRSGDLVPGLTFNKPVTVTMAYSETMVRPREEMSLTLYKALENWDTIFNSMVPSLMQKAACDFPQLEPVSNLLDVPVCDLKPGSPAQAGDGHYEFTLKQGSENLFAFMVEIEGQKQVYLPLVRRK